MNKLFGIDGRESRDVYHRSRDPFTAAALSVVPGLGQFYTGQTTKGFLFIDVAIVNFALVSMMLFTKPIVGLLQTISKEAHGRVNDDVLNAFGQMQFGHPASSALLLVIAAFAVYAGRDAYDAAKRQKRKSLYWDSVIEIAESASGSYLLHLAGMITCAVIAVFLLVPPPPKSQVTEIEFLTTPLKPTAPPVKADAVAKTNHHSTLKEVVDSNVSVRQAHAEPSHPASRKQANTSSTSHAVRASQHTTPPAPPAPPHLAPSLKPLLTMAPPATPTLPRATPPHAPTPTPLPTPVNSLVSGSQPAPQPMKTQAQSNLPLLPSATAIATTGSTPGPRLPHALQSTGSPSQGQAQPGPIAISSALGNSNDGPTPASAPSTGRGPGHSVSTGDLPGPSKGLRPLGSNGPSVAFAKPDLGARPGTKNESSDNGKDQSGKDGPKTRVEDVDFTKYMANLQRRIKSHWIPPRFPTSNQVRVTFKVSMTGELSGLRLDRSSGDPIVDKAALEAIRESAPFPNLPAGADKTEACEDGKVAIQFTFDYNVFGGKGRVLGF